MALDDPRTAALREAQEAIEAVLANSFMVSNDYDAGCEQGLNEAISIIEKLIT